MESAVYFIRLADGAGGETQAEAMTNILLAADFPALISKRDFVAIKLHVGEKHNTTHLRPELAAAAVKVVRQAGGEPFLTDTSTLYRGERENAIRHCLHAHAHGFGIENTGAPFLPLDGLSGSHEREVEVNGELNRRVKVAGEVFIADALLSLSHATGHMASGLGAALKNLGMGLSSRAGKMRQHSSIQPQVSAKRCANCGKCRKWCPENAIGEMEGASFIIAEKCIGCGECIAVCRFSAVKYNYKIESEPLQKSMVEHAAAVVRHFGDKAMFVNSLMDMTQNCDCITGKQKKLIPDLGLLASPDVVALDQATLDLAAGPHGKSLGRSFPGLDPEIQLAHAQKLKLGRRKYRLVEVP